MRRSLLPAALAVVASLTLAGCGTGAFPTPTATPTEPATPTPTASATIIEEPDEPTTVAALPSNALLRVSVTAEAGGEKVRLVLTFARASGSASRPGDVQSVLEACPDAVEAQLELLPGFEPVGVITSQLTTTGDWPDGLRFGVAAGGLIAAIGQGPGVEPTTAAAGAFGCAVPVVSGPGTASFTSLLVGDPALPVRNALDAQVEQGLFGIEADADSVPVRWTNCVVQLSAVAERFAEDSGWIPPTEWGGGCLIGDGGTV